jgi:hypothetical protein
VWFFHTPYFHVRDQGGGRQVAMIGAKTSMSAIALPPQLYSWRVKRRT